MNSILFPINAKDTSSECVICFETTELITYDCGHKACKECTKVILEFPEPKCHTCRRSISYLKRIHTTEALILLFGMFFTMALLIQLGGI
jgi:hypothetical protein